MHQQQKLRIIIIDDNPAIHQDFIKILIRNKNSLNEDLSTLEDNIFGADNNETELELPLFEIDTASQGEEGVQKIAASIKSGNPFALAFVDIRMPPGWDGIETIKHIWALDPNIQVVICTAYSDYSWEETVKQLGHNDKLLILKKPFDNIAVRQLAYALTNKWQLMRDVKAYTHNLESRVEEKTSSLVQSLSLMRATFESSAEGILVVDNAGVINDYNSKFLELLGRSQFRNDQTDFPVLIKYLTQEINNVNEFLADINKINTHSEEIIIGKLHFKDDRTYEYYTQPYMSNQKILGRVWSIRDITQRESLQNELEFQAKHDPLTGLPNRVLLLEKIKKAMIAAEKNKRQFAILFLDLDRFKLVNDSLSHEAGDNVLRSVAERLKKIIGKKNILARLGGDEFVIIMEAFKNKSKILDLCEKILDSFKEKFIIYDHDITLTVSIGICIYPQDGKEINVLLRNADIAMYLSKELGANQYQFYTVELNQKNLQRLEKESELRQAILNNEFVLFYQPQFDLNMKKLVSVEALIRWQHPEKGLIYPIDFIPLAEETGLIIPIGEWVLRCACEQAKAWQEQGLEPIRVAVNITTKQFRLFNLVEIIKNILQDTKLDPQYLELELTENVIINNADIINTICDLKKMGVQIALDDFGTGYSSLNYLRKIPVDRLKIDQSYIQNIGSDRGDSVIIQAIIAMAKSLNLEVLAEGVETESQLSFLRNSNCGEVQGFYFSKPISAKECQKLMKEADATQMFELLHPK